MAAAEMQLPISLDDILSVQQVSVVQAVDAGQLKATLAWFVSQLQRCSDREQALERGLQELREKQEKDIDPTDKSAKVGS